MPGENLKKLKIKNYPVTQNLIRLIISKFTNLEELNIDCGVYNEKIYESLSLLPKLKYLELNTNPWGVSANFPTKILKLTCSTSLKKLKILGNLPSKTKNYFKNIKCDIIPVEAVRGYKVYYKFLDHPHSLPVDVVASDKIDNL